MTTYLAVLLFTLFALLAALFLALLHAGREASQWRQQAEQAQDRLLEMWEENQRLLAMLDENDEADWWKRGVDQE